MEAFLLSSSFLSHAYHDFNSIPTLNGYVISVPKKEKNRKSMEALVWFETALPVVLCGWWFWTLISVRRAFGSWSFGWRNPCCCSQEVQVYHCYVIWSFCCSLGWWLTATLIFDTWFLVNICLWKMQNYVGGFRQRWRSWANFQWEKLYWHVNSWCWNFFED